MSFNIVRETAASLSEYASVSGAFTVERVMDIRESEPGRYQLWKRAAERSYLKDYDSVESPDSWPDRFDLAHWVFLAAWMGDERIGGAALALTTAGITDHGGQSALGVLWDIRVQPEARWLGVGSGLLQAVEMYAARAGCREIMVETQDINVPACRFYEARGYLLRSAIRNAYPTCPDDVQLLWHKDLSSALTR